MFFNKSTLIGSVNAQSSCFSMSGTRTDINYVLSHSSDSSKIMSHTPFCSPHILKFIIGNNKIYQKKNHLARLSKHLNMVEKDESFSTNNNPHYKND